MHRRPAADGSNLEDDPAKRETIALRVAGNGKPVHVVVLSKRVDRIQVILEDGTHTVFCELKPTRDALAYVGHSMGRELVYERSRAQVQADIEAAGTALEDSGRS